MHHCDAMGAYKHDEEAHRKAGLISMPAISENSAYGTDRKSDKHTAQQDMHDVMYSHIALGAT